MSLTEEDKRWIEATLRGHLEALESSIRAAIVAGAGLVEPKVAMATLRVLEEHKDDAAYSRFYPLYRELKEMLSKP
jgi:hypothetical protein